MKSRTEKPLLWFYIGIALFAISCYNPFALYFQNDDFIHIPLSRDGVLFQRNSFRPICDLSIILDEYLWGKKAFGDHLTNLLLHVICCALVFTSSLRITEKYFAETSHKYTASIVTLLFFVFATHSEAVLWILGRSAILGLIFSLLFLLQFLKRERGSPVVIAYVFLLFTALLTYESTFVLPVICCILFIADRRKNDWRHLVLVWICFLIYLLTRRLITGEFLGTYEVTNIQGSGLSSIFLNFFKLFVRCFIPAYTQGWFLVILFALVTIGVWVLLFRHLKVKLLMLAVVFLVSLLPYVMLGIDAHGYEGERYLYMPSFLLCLLLVIVVQQQIQNKLVVDFALLFIITAHVISLSKSADNFRFAGNINRMIVKAINQVGDKDTLYVIQLPQAQNGALIMRDGFRQAVDWLSENKTKPIILVQSKRSEWKPLNSNYKTNDSDSIFRNGMSLNQTGNTALLYFTDSCLYIRK